LAVLETIEAHEDFDEDMRLLRWLFTEQ